MLKSFGLIALAVVALAIAGCGGVIRAVVAERYQASLDPLTVAVWEDNPAEAVRLLKSKGITNVYPETYKFGKIAGYTFNYDTPPLAFAARSGACKVLEAFLNFDADAKVNWRFSNGEPLLHYAIANRLSVGYAHRGSRGCVQALLSRGADPNLTNPDGYNALHLAAKHGDGGAVRVLLAHGVDPNARDVIDGNTALHLVKSSDRGAIAALLEGGADRSIRNNKGMLAQQSGDALQATSDARAAAQAQRDREDEIRDEARRERDRRAREAANARGLSLQLCMLDPKCRRELPY